MQGAVHHAGKLGMYAVGGYLHAAADMLQPGACIICDLLRKGYSGKFHWKEA